MVEDEFRDIIEVVPLKVKIEPRTKDTYFEITVKSSKIPSSPVTIEFSLSSFYKIVHELVPNTKYLSFSLNRES